MLTLLGVHNFLSLYQVSVRFEWYINNNNWPLSVWQECFKIKTFRFKDENATTSTRFDLTFFRVLSKYRLPGKLHLLTFDILFSPARHAKTQGHPATVFCIISVRRSKHCLEFSFAWGRLKIYRWTFHSCTIFEAHLINSPRFSEVWFFIFY